MIQVNKNVLFVSMSDKANGAENVLLMAAKVIRAPMIFLQKVKNGGLKFSQDQQLTYVTDKSMLAGFWGLAKSLKSYRKGFIIISTHPYLSAYLGFLKRIGYLKSQLIVRECTSVFTRYSGFKRWTYQVAYRFGYPGASLIVCQTALMRNQFLKHVSFIQPQKVIIQENPIDMEQAIIKANQPLNDIDAGSDFICAAGRLIPEKGFSVLIKAFSCIIKQYPDLNLLLFGEGPEKQLLTGLIKSHKLEGRVLLKGWTDNPLPYFKKARVCVVSSIKEGFPNVLLEMMALNPVVVSTLCAGGIETIPCIEKTEVNNVNALIIALKKALHKDGEHEKKTVQQYLGNRKPEVFLRTILSALQ